MISVIICSREKFRLDHLIQNIRETIGAEHEILATDNAQARDGICKVYNSGGDKAKFDLLCFVHEDVEFVTSGWGRCIAAHLQDKKTGLIGIAGGDTKSIVPSSWYISSRSNQVNVFQHYPSSNASPAYIRVTENNGDSRAQKVAAMDGVFLCTRKEVFNQYRFDEQQFPRFHGYDIDYSLQVSADYELKVIFDVVIHHYSEGKPGKQWLESALQVSRKWKNRLPISVHQLSKKEFSDHHWTAMQVFLQRMINLNYPVYFIGYHFLYYSFTSFFTIRRMGSMIKYLITQLFQRYIKQERTKFLLHTN